MNIDNLVGSNIVRWAAAGLLTVWLLSVVVYTRELFPELAGLSFGVVVGTGLLTFVAFVHTTRAIYSRWLKIAAAIHSVVVTVLFGSIYLLIVPLFAMVVWPFDLLKLRKHRRAETFWIRKQQIGGDHAFFQRMG